MKNTLYLLALALIVSIGTASAQSTCASVVKNIGKNASDGEIVFPTKINSNTLLFFASDELYGQELWRTDGTLTGTKIVADICPGLCSSGTSNAISARPAVVNGIMIFTISRSPYGVWRSDGTSEGTYKIINETSGRYFTVYKNAVYFWDLNGNLWKTEGSKESTIQLTQRLRGGSTSEWAPMVEFKNELWFITNNDIWRTNGTTQGTIRLGTNIEDATAIVSADDKLFFVSTFGTLYQTDGSLNGTKLVRESVVNGTFVAPEAYKLYSVKGIAYFIGNDGTLWRSDGTLTGTYSITSLKPQQLITYKNNLYFILPEKSKSKIWKTDGSLSGTQSIVNITPETESLSTLNAMTEQDGLIYFFATVSSSASTSANNAIKSSREGIWQTDGSQSGTRFICSLSDGENSISNYPLWTDAKPFGYKGYPGFVKLNDYLLFIGSDSFFKYGIELYSTLIINCPAITATITGTSTFCQRASTVLSAAATGGTAPYTYRWQQGTTVVGTGAATLTVNTAGEYTVTATDANGCVGTAQVTATQRTTPTVTIPATISFCTGQTVTLTTQTTGGTGPYTYTWRQSGASVGTSAGTLSVNAGGTYAVSVTDASGCASTSATTTVIQRPSPTATLTASAPGVIGGSSVTLTASTGTGQTYQWTRDGQPIAGATQATYATQQPGSYAVVVSLNGCSATAQATPVSVITAVEAPLSGPDFTLSASPNPGAGVVQVRIVTQPGRTVAVTLSVRDLTGRSLYQKQLSVSGQHTEQLDLTAQPAAIYLLNAASEGQQTSLRLLRQ